MQAYTHSHTNMFQVLLPHSHNVSEVLWILDIMFTALPLKNYSVKKQASANLLSVHIFICKCVFCGCITVKWPSWLKG